MAFVFWFILLSITSRGKCVLDPYDDGFPVSDQPFVFANKENGNITARNETVIQKANGNAEGSGHGLQESLIRVASTVETEPPCMLPGEVTSSGHRRDTTSHFREVLNFEDLTNEEVQLATRIAQHQYMESSTYDLKITKLLGGCKQYISGYLYFLMFKAIQTTPCQFVSQQNCTGVIKLYQECRARVHTSYLVPWNPFYVACHPTSYYSLPWRRLVS